MQMIDDEVSTVETPILETEGRLITPDEINTAILRLKTVGASRSAEWEQGYATGKRWAIHQASFSELQRIGESVGQQRLCDIAGVPCGDGRITSAEFGSVEWFFGNRLKMPGHERATLLGSHKTPTIVSEWGDGFVCAVRKVWDRIQDHF